MTATVLHLPAIPSQPRPEDAHGEEIPHPARVLFEQGFTPADLDGCPRLKAEFAAPLAALIEAGHLLALHATPETLLACCGDTPGFTAIAVAMRELSP